MAAPSSPLVGYSQYLAARLAAMSLMMFNVETNLRTARMIGRQLYRFDHRHRERAKGHLKLAFPEKSDMQIDELTEKSFEHFVQLAVEVLHTPRLIHHDSWPGRIKTARLSPAIELLNTGKPAILITGHLGNWEMCGYLLAVIGYKMDVIYRPIDNPLVNDWLLGIRMKRGMRIITKWNATERMLQVLSDGGMLGFIADQNAGEKGMFVPFFGALASTYKSIGLLAISQNVPIVCGYANRASTGFNFELGVQDIIRPEDWATKDDPLYYVTARYMRAIEDMIRLSPEQYLWMHRRWKSRPRHEKLGKPMPKSLQRNIEALPWMDQQNMDRLLTAPPLQKP